MIVYIALPPEASKSCAPKAMATRKIFQTLTTCADKSYEVKLNRVRKLEASCFSCRTFLEK